MAKKNETPQEEVKQETPVQDPVETTEQETPQEEVKVYKFTSSNKYLTVAHLGIQFREGKAETTNLEVARALAKVGGVDLVEE